MPAKSCAADQSAGTAAVGPMLPDSRLAVPSAVPEPSPVIVAAFIGAAILFAYGFKRKDGAT